MNKLLTFLAITMLLVPAVLAKSSKPTEPLEKITFIHYKDGTVKQVGGTSKAPICYKLLGVQWKTLPVSYVINPTNSNLPENTVTNAISTSAETWDTSTSRELFNNEYTIDKSATWDDTPDEVDYKNEYVFGTYSNSNVIAVTNIWYTRYSRQIIDYDVLFNTYYIWKDCSVSGTDCSNAMDVLNIATHETGHGIGLADIYTSSCSAVTMYGYSRYGETQKRTLEQPDITGLQKLYGA